MEIVSNKEATCTQVHDVEEGHTFKYEGMVFMRTVTCSTIVLEDGSALAHVLGVNLETGKYFACPPDVSCLVEQVIAKVVVD